MTDMIIEIDEEGTIVEITDPVIEGLKKGDIKVGIETTETTVVDIITIGMIEMIEGMIVAGTIVEIIVLTLLNTNTLPSRKNKERLRKNQKESPVPSFVSNLLRKKRNVSLVKTPMDSLGTTSKKSKSNSLISRTLG